MQKCLSESQASELKFLLKQKISGIPIRSGYGLNDGDGQTTEGDSSTPVMRMMKHTASPAVMFMMVGKGHSNTMYEQ